MRQKYPKTMHRSGMAARRATHPMISLAPVLLATLMVMLAPVASADAQIAPDGLETHGNVARNRPHSLSVAPNYNATRADAATVLTDGRVASEPYWQNGTALGWAALSPVTVSIGLAEPTAVSHVRVQAGAKTSGEIYFPSQIFVFGGDGAERFAFLGATAVNQDRESPDAAALRQFDIRFPAQVVKDIVVIAFARGRFVFLGEIAAFGTPHGAALAGYLPSLDAVRAEAAVRRVTAIEAIKMPQPTGPAITRRWAMPLDAEAGGVRLSGRMAVAKSRGSNHGRMAPTMQRPSRPMRPCLCSPEAATMPRSA